MVVVVVKRAVFQFGWRPTLNFGASFYGYSPRVVFAI